MGKSAPYIATENSTPLARILVDKTEDSFA